MFTDFAIFFKGRAVRKAISRKAIADFTEPPLGVGRTKRATDW